VSISERLRAARLVLGLKQEDASSKFGVAKSTYQKYEAGSSIPGGEAIAGFIGAGINANWLLTGEGPMLLEELQPKPQPTKINADALAAILMGAMKALPKADTGAIADFAVKMYLDVLERGLITPDGVGKGDLGEVS
jgi:transcriptional regulator with XRE-family HTH domain